MSQGLGTHHTTMGAPLRYRVRLASSRRSHIEGQDKVNGRIRQRRMTAATA